RVTGRDILQYVSRKKIVHVDCDPSSIDKNVPVDLGIVADIKDLLTTVNSRVKPNGRAVWLKQVEKWKAKDAAHPECAPYRGRGVSARRVIEAIWNATKGMALLVADVGDHQMACARHFRHSCPRHFLSSGGMGTMGFAIPAAIGAAIAKPDHKIVAVVGDGGAQMTSEELIVAVEEKLPITFVIMNNRALGMVNTPIASPDFVKLSQAHGLRGVRVADPKRIDAAIAKAVRAKGPFLVEVEVGG
ncbi:MAG: thiamine pyrophosphate-dependent enzyme, partial [Kiritimatiellae bacterium]|nr:thiamine pyrophosphate-dependent enzyme [Kiritimatiellia bacterium]